MATTLIYLRREKSDDFVFNIKYLRRKKTAKILLILLMYASRRVQILRVAGVWYGVMIFYHASVTLSILFFNYFKCIFVYFIELSSYNKNICPGLQDWEQGEWQQLFYSQTVPTVHIPRYMSNYYQLWAVLHYIFKLIICCLVALMLLYRIRTSPVYKS